MVYLFVNVTHMDWTTRMKTSGNTILVTGGGSGIGEAIAHRLHDAGNTVIIAGRRQAALDAAIAGRSGMQAITFDAADTTSIVSLAERVTAQYPALNVLINNAGIMRNEDVASRRDLTDAEAQVATNLLGPIRLIDALVDHLKAQADSAIINVTSGLAFVPLVRAATYSATKAALHSYTMALRAALAGKVEVIEWAPPAVRTGLTPGQEKNEMFLPLADFIDESYALMMQAETPSEIIVQRAKFQRNAEAEDRFPATFKTLNGL